MSIWNTNPSSGGGSVDWVSVTSKPSTFPPTAHTHLISEVFNLQSVLDNKLNTDSVIDYTTLSNKPSIPTNNNQIANGAGYITLAEVPAYSQVNANWLSNSGVSQILNKPTLFSGSYTDLSNKPALFSGAYSDLSGKPALFSGSYVDLINKPTSFAPSAHTHVIADITGLQSALDNKVSVGASIPYSVLTGVPAGFTGSYLDLTNKPSTFPPSSHSHVIADVTGLQAALDSKTTTGASIPYSSLSGTPTIPAAQVSSDWNSVTGVSQILNKPTIPSITGLRKTETFLGTTDASGNYAITFANTYASAPDVQPNIIGGNFNQFVRVVSVSTTGCVVQCAQRNTVNLLSTELLLGTTVALVGSSVTVQITARS